MLNSRVICLVVLFACPAAALLPAVRPARSDAVVYRIGPDVRRLIAGLRHLEIPAQIRRQNWIGDKGEGSCVHASVVHLLLWQGKEREARWWEARYANGETAAGLAKKLESAGFRFAETRTGDAAFLAWAIRTRRGAAVVVQQGSHMVNLVGLDAKHARILDGNAPRQVQVRSRDEFLTEWRQSGGWGVTVVGTPPAAEPWVVK